MSGSFCRNTTNNKNNSNKPHEALDDLEDESRTCIRSIVKRTTLRIKKDGTIEWLVPPPFPVPVVNQTKQRFSEIVPTDPLRCLAFRILRKLFGETGRVSDWTRSWRCLWTGRILTGRWRGSEFISPFRAAVLEWEHSKWEHDG